MNAPQKIAVFAAGLVVIFAAAFGIGATVGPDGGDVATEHQRPRQAVHNVVDADPPAGLSATEGGYTLNLAQGQVRAGRQTALQFRITDPTGAAVKRYVDNHEKPLHLIVVRRDMVGYQHVHPTLDGDGTWRAAVSLSAGDYRVFADFIPAGGEAMTLGADLRAAGVYDPRPLPAAATTATVDGYTVTLRGSPKANESSALTFSVSRDGKPVTDLQPYLGAYGHLVVLRASDLAYLHVHPVGEPGDGTRAAGPQIGFGTTVPSNGDYRLFLDFKHRDVVRTAEFTLSIDGSVDPAAPPAEVSEGHGH